MLPKIQIRSKVVCVSTTFRWKSFRIIWLCSGLSDFYEWRYLFLKHVCVTKKSLCYRIFKLVTENSLCYRKLNMPLIQKKLYTQSWFYSGISHSHEFAIIMLPKIATVAKNPFLLPKIHSVTKNWLCYRKLNTLLKTLIIDV